MNIRKIMILPMLAIAGAASGSIVGVSGDSTLIAQPADARFNQLVSAPQVFVWNEAQNVALNAPIHANAQTPGLYNQTSDLEDITINPARIGISSHFIHFDSQGAQVGAATGSVTFDGEILGVIAVNESNMRDLDNSDFLGNPTLFSHNNNNRGLEFSPSGDRFSISADRLTIEFHFEIAAPGDYMRVITLVPTPGAGTLLAASGLLALRRRR